MKKAELLLPVGDFECLKAAVQNGADSVYLGSNLFSARAFATNFDNETFKSAVQYARLRNVDVHLTLNTLIKNNEFEDAISLAKYAYEIGVSAIIVQDLGLAKYLIDNIPDLPIHASTQMTIHNLEGALMLEQLGFKRNTNIEIETFIHGALCISYSGQCLMSSMIGGRSGNRGKCAQSCRLPYSLIQDNKKIDTGYLLSPRDLCSVDFLPELLNANIDCFKIEGRMKSPEYVGLACKIYRKYIDLAMSYDAYHVDDEDKKTLMQIFNRGGFSSGHLLSTPNKSLIFKDKPNNMGLFLGNVKKFNSQKGYITFDSKESLEIGDTISFEHEDTKYRISELMIENKNIKIAKSNDKITIGRMKGNINIGDKIYKLSSSSLFNEFKKTIQNENKKHKLCCHVYVKKDKPISLKVFSCNEQISKTGNTIFEFENISVDIDEHIFVPNMSSTLNDLRRNALSHIENELCNKITRAKIDIPQPSINSKTQNSCDKEISILLNKPNLDYDYTNVLPAIDNVYIPLKYFTYNSYKNIIENISRLSNIYIYMPIIMRNNYIKLFKKNINYILNSFNIKGFVVSNIGQLELLKTYKDSYEFIGNYSLNMYNNFTETELQNKIFIAKQFITYRNNHIWCYSCYDSKLLFTW